jgi:L-phenylalanine/L-methionine N-acetyltransferase
MPGEGLAPAFSLRRARVSDAADFAQLMSHPDVFGNLMQMPWPSESVWATRLADPPGAAAGASADLHLVAERDGRVIGSAGLHPQVQPRRRHVAMLGISVAREAQGHGVGHALMQALCSYCDDWAQIHRIELTVFTDNERAIALYHRCGFVDEGVHRGYAMRNGVYSDVIAMARWRPGPLP